MNTIKCMSHLAVSASKQYGMTFAEFIACCIVGSAIAFVFVGAVA